MNRRSFLMKLGAGLVGALVVRPTIEYTFSPDGGDLGRGVFNGLYGGAAGGGKSIAIMHPTQFNAYMKLLNQVVIDNPRQVGVITNISEPTWDKMTRSQVAFFRS